MYKIWCVCNWNSQIDLIRDGMDITDISVLAGYIQGSLSLGELGRQPPEMYVWYVYVYVCMYVYALCMYVPDLWWCMIGVLDICCFEQYLQHEHPA